MSNVRTLEDIAINYSYSTRKWAYDGRSQTSTSVFVDGRISTHAEGKYCRQTPVPSTDGERAVSGWDCRLSAILVAER